MELRKLDLKKSVSVAASPEQTWAVFTDIERWPSWNPICLAAEPLSGEPWTPGFRFSMTLRMGGRPITFKPTVVEADRPHRLKWSSTYLSITGERTFTFRYVEGVTIVTDEKTFTSPYVPVSLVYPRQIVHNMSDRWLRMLAIEVQRQFGGELPKGGAIPEEFPAPAGRNLSRPNP